MLRENAMTINFEPSKPEDAVILGRATIDLYANQIGPMEQAVSFNRYVGGSAANTAVAMARLGLHVGYIGKVSDDPFGRYIVNFLKKEGIDVSHIETAQAGIKSGITVGEILPDSCNYFVYRDHCADLQIRCEQLDEAYIGRFKLMLISGTSLSHSPAREAVYLAIEMAKRQGTKVAIDLDFREGTWDTAEEASIYYSLAAQLADIVIGTRDEFDMMESCVCPGGSSNQESARRLLDKGVQLVAIKNGKAGSYIFTEEGCVKGGIYPTKVLKSFGAGDSYSSAFQYGLLHRFSIETSLQYAAAASSITITGHSCSDAMPDLKQVEDYIDKHEYVV